MHVIIWEFGVREERVLEFVSACSSDGDWAKLFGRADGYLETELLRSSQASNVFVTIDRWENASCFENFQEQFGSEYKKLDAAFEGYTWSEKKLGVFSEP